MIDRTDSPAGASTFRRRVELVLAAAEERAVRAQIAAAADFVVDVAEEVPLERALSICLRLLDVSERDRRSVRTRVLAHLHGMDQSDRLVDRASDDDNLIDRFLHRLRGRRNDRLRARVTVAANRARAMVQRQHVSNARAVTVVFDDVLSPAEAVQLYVDRACLGTARGADVFHDALSIIPAQPES